MWPFKKKKISKVSKDILELMREEGTDIEEDLDGDKVEYGK